MRRISKILAGGLAAICGWVTVGHASLASACRAQEMLGPQTWSRVLRIDNADPRGPYPRTVYATVFAFDGILWFYTDANGTQSLSLYRGRLAQDEADFGPLLRAIDPGFRAYREVKAEPSEPAAARGASAPLENGCFIASLCAARRCLARGMPILRANLLLYYAQCGGDLRGHCVFVYETPHGVFFIDPDEPETAYHLDRTMPGSPLTLAKDLPENLIRLSIVRARYIPLPVMCPARPGGPLHRRGAALLSRAGAVPTFPDRG